MTTANAVAVLDSPINTDNKTTAELESLLEELEDDVAFNIGDHCPTCGYKIKYAFQEPMHKTCAGCDEETHGCPYCVHTWYGDDGEEFFLCNTCNEDVFLCERCDVAYPHKPATFICSNCECTYCINCKCDCCDQCHSCSEKGEYSEPESDPFADSPYNDGTGVSGTKGSSTYVPTLDKVHQVESGWEDVDGEWSEHWAIDNKLSLNRGAADYYLLEPIEHNVDVGEIAEPMLITMSEQAKGWRKELIAAYDPTFCAYVDMAIGGELRYHRAFGGGRHIDRHRGRAWVEWRYARKLAGPDLLLDAASRFNEMGGSYGGPPWANAAKLLHARLTRQLSPAQWVDRVFTMQHNSGSLLNKIRWGPNQNEDGSAITTEIGPAHASDPPGWYTLLTYASPQARNLFTEWILVSNRNRLRWRRQLWRMPGVMNFDLNMAMVNQIAGWLNYVLHNGYEDRVLSPKQTVRLAAMKERMEELGVPMGQWGECPNWVGLFRDKNPQVEPIVERFRPYHRIIRGLSNNFSVTYHLSTNTKLELGEIALGMSEPHDLWDFISIIDKDEINNVETYKDWWDSHQQHYPDPLLALATRS